MNYKYISGNVLLTLTVLSFLYSLLACNDGGINGNPSPSLVRITVTPTVPSVTVDATQEFKAKGTYSDNSTKDLTASATWTSSNTTVAKIIYAGTASAVSAGTATITATSGTVANSATVTVRNAVTGPADDLLYSFYAGFDILGFTDTLKLQQVFTMAGTDLDLNYLKVNFRWDKIQPNNADEFVSDIPDLIADYAESNHLSIIPFFNQQGTPVWAQNTVPPVDTSSCTRGVTYITKDPSYFSQYVRKFVSKYKDRMSIRYIELENEPNALCLWPDTAQYLAQVDNAVYDEVKNSDPSIRVCSASFHQPLGFPLDLSGYPTNLAADHAYSEQFLKDYLVYLDKGFDCFSIHDYARIGFTETDSTYPFSSQYDLESNYRAVLDQYRFPNTQIVFTECSYEISTFGNDEDYAAAQMVQGYVLAHAKGIAQGRMCQAITKGPTGAANYGITDITGAEPIYYSGYYAFQTMRKLMLEYPNHAQHVAGLTNDDGYWIEKFTNESGVNTLYIAFVPIRFDTAKGWPKQSPPPPQTALINIGIGKTAIVTTMKGVPASMTDVDGNLSLLVDAEPVYIEVP